MDPIVETAKTLVETLLTNPIVGPMLYGTARSITGYIQNKWKEKSGKPFDKAEFGATLVKYEVAINSIVAVLPVDFKYVGALVVLADILGSWANKLMSKDPVVEYLRSKTN